MNTYQIEKKKRDASKHMIRLLQSEPDQFIYAGEVDCTKLAEETADVLDIYEDDVDYNIPEWLFDQAVIVAEKFETR